MRALVTGASSGIGLAIARAFLAAGHEVAGIDVKDGALNDAGYTHFIADVSRPETLPDIEGVQILVNNAGVQDSGRDVEVNLLGTVNCTEKYGMQPEIRAIVNIASASAHSGAEFPLYAASKGGVLAYTKNAALRVARYGATCNSISPGGVTTASNARVIENPELWRAVMDETLLPKWASEEELADWTLFVATVNKSMTAQDILIDNGELAKSNFVW